MLIVAYTEIRLTIYEYATTIECNICKIYLNHVYGMPPTEEQHQKLIEDIRA